MTQPRRTHDAYAGVVTINSATSHRIVFAITYQGENDILARVKRGNLSPGQMGYACAGWYWSTFDGKSAGPFTSSRGAFRDAVLILSPEKAP